MATILLCVTGSIAAYKAADLCSKLVQAGHTVTAIMTEAATKLVGPATFQNLTGNRVYLDLWDPVGQTEHIALTDRADLVVVAPATANCLAKLAHGLADDMVSTTLLAVACPVLVCPAMNQRMWRNLAVQQNVARCKTLGHHVLEPTAGSLACGHVGQGRLPEVPEILAEVERLVGGASGRERDPLVAIVPDHASHTPVRLPGDSAERSHGDTIDAPGLSGAPVSSTPAVPGRLTPQSGVRRPATPAEPERLGADAYFLEVVTYEHALSADAQASERAYRAAALASGAIVASGGLGEKRRAHVHRARSMDEVLDRARRSPAAGLHARIEVFPWRIELGLPPGGSSSPVPVGPGSAGPFGTPT